MAEEMTLPDVGLSLGWTGIDQHGYLSRSLSQTGQPHTISVFIPNMETGAFRPIIAL
jgi:hypothetical protein